MIATYAVIILVAADLSCQIKEEKELNNRVRASIYAMAKSPAEPGNAASNAKTLVEVGRRLTPVQTKFLLPTICRSLRGINEPSPVVIDYCIDNLSYTLSAVATGGSDHKPDRFFPAAKTLRHIGESGHQETVIKALSDRMGREMTLVEQYITSLIFREIADEETSMMLSNVVRNEGESNRKQNARLILQMSKSPAPPDKAVKETSEIFELLGQNPKEFTDPDRILNRLIRFRALAPNKMLDCVPRICNMIGEIGDPTPAILEYCARHLDCFGKTPQRDQPDSCFPAAQALRRMGERGYHVEVRDVIMERTASEMSSLELHLAAVTLREADEDKRIWKAVKNKIRSDKTMKPIQRRNLERMLAYYESPVRPIETRAEIVRTHAREIMELLKVKTPAAK